MKRTQLYLDEQLWDVLHSRAKSLETSISELVREAVRERYFGARDERTKAMRAFVGVGKTGAQAPDAVDYVQSLRRSNRLERIHK